jgi:hypothetical protein
MALSVCVQHKSIHGIFFFPNSKEALFSRGHDLLVFGFSQIKKNPPYLHFMEFRGWAGCRVINTIYL